MRTGNEERKVEDIKFLKAQLNQQLFMISQPNEKVMEASWQRWDSIGKPLRSLGALERAVVKMAGMENTVNVKMDNSAIVVLCRRSWCCEGRGDPDRQQCDKDCGG